MGRLSEYDKAEQRYFKGITPQVPSPVLVEGAPPRELRWEDLDARWRRFYAALPFILSAPDAKEE